MKEYEAVSENLVSIERERFAPTVEQLILQKDEADLIEDIADKLLEKAPFPSEAFFDSAAIAAQGLPERVRVGIYQFRRYGKTHGIHIKGFPINDNDLTPTPSNYRGVSVSRIRLNPPQAVHAMFSSLLGEPIAWKTQQSGNFFNDIIPIQENSGKAISSGSENLFDLHTEDAALYPYIPDYLGLMGLRNVDRTPTIISAVDWESFDPEIKNLLFEPRYIVGVNIAHDMGQPTKPYPVLFGSIDHPYIRVNQNLQHAVPGDLLAEEALDRLTEELNQNIVEVPVDAGSFFYLNNNVAAHGRRAYEPRYDGTDRWLQRLTIVANPRDFVDITVSGTRTLQPIKA